MILAAIIRQFAPHPDEVVLLEKSFPLATTPSVGARLRIAGEPTGPLRVVQVMVRSRPAPGELHGSPAVEIYTAPEPAGSIAAARARGWHERERHSSDDAA